MKSVVVMASLLAITTASVAGESDNLKVLARHTKTIADPVSHVLRAWDDPVVGPVKQAIEKSNYRDTLTIKVRSYDRSGNLVSVREETETTSPDGRIEKRLRSQQTRKWENGRVVETTYESSHGSKLEPKERTVFQYDANGCLIRWAREGSASYSESYSCQKMQDGYVRTSKYGRELFDMRGWVLEEVKTESNSMVFGAKTSSGVTEFKLRNEYIYNPEEFKGGWHFIQKTKANNENERISDNRYIEKIGTSFAHQNPNGSWVRRVVAKEDKYGNWLSRSYEIKSGNDGAWEKSGQRPDEVRTIEYFK